MKILLLNHAIDEFTVGEFGIRFHWVCVPQTETLLAEMTWRHLSDGDGRSHPLTRKKIGDLTDYDLVALASAIFIAYGMEIDPDVFEAKEQILERIVAGIREANRKMTKEPVEEITPAGGPARNASASVADGH